MEVSILVSSVDVTQTPCLLDRVPSQCSQQGHELVEEEEERERESMRPVANVATADTQHAHAEC